MISSRSTSPTVRSIPRGRYLAHAPRSRPCTITVTTYGEPWPTMSPTMPGC
jgi:hypothetical protein